MHRKNYQVRALEKKPTAARFFARTLPAALAATVCLGSAPAWAARPLDEVAATRRVCAAGPAVALARAQRLRGAAEVTAAGVLPNPSVVAEHQRSLTGPLDRETILGLSVPLGVGGRRFILEDAAEFRRDEARTGAEATLFEAALEFRHAYARTATEHARVEVLAEQQTALDGLSATVQGLSKGGEVAGYDLLRQQAAARLHRALLESAKARALGLRASLEAWIEPAAVPASVELSEPGNGAREASFASARGQETPRIQSLESAARASALEGRAARRRWVPDVEVFAGYRQLTTGPETGHGISLGLTIPVTFFDHGQGDAARADAEQELAVALSAKLRREQRAAIVASERHLSGLRTALESVESAIADAVEVQSKARQLYAAGEASITELLEAFRAAEEARMARLELIEELAEARLALMRAAGTMLDPALDRACREPERARK
jgi:outer membrane protein, heavy metal efflux system